MGDFMKIKIIFSSILMLFISTGISSGSVYRCTDIDTNTGEEEMVFTVKFSEDFLYFKDWKEREKFEKENPQFKYYSSVTEETHYFPHQGEITFEIFNKNRLDKKQTLEILSINKLVKNKDGKILKYSYFFLSEQNDIEFRTTLSDEISLRGFLSPQIINTQVKKKGSLEDEYIFSPGGVGRCEIIEEPSIKNLPSDYEPESGLKIFE